MVKTRPTALDLAFIHPTKIIVVTYLDWQVETPRASMIS